VPREGPGAAAEKAAALRASVKLDVRAAQLLTLEQRLYEASNLNHKLERRLKRADGARKELKELKKAHEALAAMDNARAMEADLAAKRIAELEGRQRALDAAAAADAEGGGGDASAEVAALRAQVAAIRHGFVERAVKKWQRGTTEAVWRAWREHTHRSQLERAANRLAERPPADWGEEEAEQDNRVAGSEYYYYSGEEDEEAKPRVPTAAEAEARVVAALAPAPAPPVVAAPPPALAPAEVDWGVAARRKASLARFRAALGDARDAATP